MMPYVTAVLMGTSLFFTAMHLFVVNPFKLGGVQMPGGAVRLFHPHDGAGLNPLLQDTLMVIHPPMLYPGFVGFAVPFAFAMAALITRQLGDTWIRTTRRWTMVAWGFLGIGILLGGNWAYHELGWGGFWAWDPVENASLMPWLIGTAFLHSVMVQEKKGMLKVWNIVLVIAGLHHVDLRHVPDAQRPGRFGSRVCQVRHRRLLPGVHRRRRCPGALYLICRPAALPEERKPDGLDGLARKQFPVQQPDPAGFLLCGVLGHDVPGALGVVHRRQDHRRSAVLQQGECSDRDLPAVPDRRRAAAGVAEGVDQQLEAQLPVAGGDRAGVRAFRCICSGVRSLLCVAVAGDVDLCRHHDRSGVLQRRAGASYGTGESFHEAIVNLTLRNTRRYGGYIIHFGFVLLFVGWSGQAFSEKVRLPESKVGDTFQIHQYDLRVEDMGVRQGPELRGAICNRQPVRVRQEGRHHVSGMAAVRRAGSARRPRK